MRTPGEIRAANGAGVTGFEQEHMGRGPKPIRTHLLGDLVVVRPQGVLTAAEQHLVQSLPPKKGGTCSNKSAPGRTKRRGRSWKRRSSRRPASRW